VVLDGSGKSDGHNGARKIRFQPEYVTDPTSLRRPSIERGGPQEWFPIAAVDVSARPDHRTDAEKNGRTTRPNGARLKYGTGVVNESAGIHIAPEQAARLGLTPGSRLIATETADGLVIRRADTALAKVIVEPTAVCNLDCTTCVRHSWSEPLGTMKMSTYEALIADLRDVPTLRKIAFWGIGEPLLHRELDRMITMAKELGAETELITNAMLLDRAMSERLVAAGLDRLIVSIDSTSPDEQADIRSGGSLERIVDNLQTLAAVRVERESQTPEVGMEFVAMRRNLHELPKLRRFSYQIGASFIIVTNLLPYSADMSDEILYGLWAGRSYSTKASGSIQDVRLPRMDARRESLLPIVSLLEHPGVLGPTPANPYGGEGYCRFVAEGTAAVSWDGGVSPCVALMHSYRCYVLGREKQIRRYTLGNVERTPITEIWALNEYSRFRDRVQRFDFSPCTNCGSCNLAETNEEDCFGNPFPVCGDCLWAKGVIQCP
jgi:MoaA/NifB/PqqE/SkfB family radical SAM enzyme